MPVLEKVSSTPTAQDSIVGITALHCATVFTSAFLLFSVQPLMGRLLLPWFGGSASVWSACMLFFQAFLLLGYAYAHFGSTRLRPRVHGLLHSGLLAACVLLLPIHLNPSTGAGQAPPLRIALILAAGIGLPYLVLSATSPLIQLWYARDRGEAPYRLYALSNAASLAALICYPTLIEPNITSHGQLLIWSTGFALFAAMCAIAAIRASRHGGTAEISSPKQPPPAWGAKLLWITLAAIPSALLLATTNHLCQNVAAIPFLWVAPLAAYLLTLILCFDYDSPRRHRVFLWLTPVALVAMGYASLYGSFATQPQFSIPLFTAGMFVVCMVFHGELVRRKPAFGNSTSFYLMVSLGGAIGSACIVLIAPNLLTGVFDLPILLVTASMSLLFLYYRRHWWIDAIWTAVSVTVLIFAMIQVRAFSAGVRVSMRSFYGALRIVDGPLADGSAGRVMVHGTISHGAQFLDAARKNQPTTYYAPGTGAWLVLEKLRRGPQSAGIIGLGAGTLAAYARPGDHYVFYELNPQVIALARSEFTWVGTPAVEIVEGDGRLALSRDARVFDVLLTDAFSGDSIPTHLLTEEALRVYLAHLAPDGLLAMHISNSVLDLESPVAKLAESAELYAALVHTPADPHIDRSEATWVIMARSAGRLRDPDVGAISRPLRIAHGQRLWTDDYSNLFQLLKR